MTLTVQSLSQPQAQKGQGSCQACQGCLQGVKGPCHPPSNTEGEAGTMRALDFCEKPSAYSSLCVHVAKN